MKTVELWCDDRAKESNDAAKKILEHYGVPYRTNHDRAEDWSIEPTAFYGGMRYRGLEQIEGMADLIIYRHNEKIKCMRKRHQEHMFQWLFTAAAIIWMQILISWFRIQLTIPFAVVAIGAGIFVWSDGRQTIKRAMIPKS